MSYGSPDSWLQCVQLAKNLCSLYHPLSFRPSLPVSLCLSVYVPTQHVYR